MIGMKIYYVRHGQTNLNLAKKMQGGGTEKELNETGISQAYNTKKELENSSSFFGGLPGNRTPDTLIKSQVLYRLS